MMEILKDFPDNVLAVRASGQVTRKDYDDVLIPAARAAFAKHEHLMVYYETTADFTGFDIGAMWEDMVFGIANWKHWKRIAVVTDRDWIRNVSGAFSVFMPCPVKAFIPAEAAQARAWLANEPPGMAPV